MVLKIRGLCRIFNYVCSSASNPRRGGLPPARSEERPGQTSVYPVAVGLSLGLACSSLVFWTHGRDSLLAIVVAVLGATLLACVIAAWLLTEWRADSG